MNWYGWDDVMPVRKARILPWLLLVTVLWVMFGGDPPSSATTQHHNHKPKAKQAAPSRTARADIPSRLLPIYRSAGKAESVPWSTLAAVGKVESNHCRNMGPSSAGALGCMQFMPGTWTSWGRGGDIYDPKDSIPAAARFLHALGINRNPSWALAAYNAGPGRADHPPTSTIRYVANVRALARRYARSA